VRVLYVKLLSGSRKNDYSSKILGFDLTEKYVKNSYTFNPPVKTGYPIVTVITKKLYVHIAGYKNNILLFKVDLEYSNANGQKIIEYDFNIPLSP
jgi:hypothetical protein